ARQKGLDLRLDLDPGVPETLVGDPHRLRQVVVNILSNAIKFTAGGSVELRLRVDVDLGTSLQLLTSVRDTGIGIPKELHATIFDPFRQADESVARRYGGTGLGLAISSELVSLMQGRIWLESAAGEGSTFYFTVTLGKAPAPGASDTPARRLRVLLAEDNAINQKLAMRLLEKRGHEVVVAADGHETLAAFERDCFDAILMDVQMPGLDGIDVTTRIRQREKGTGRHVAVIAMTANTVPGDRERCLAAGMDAFLAKPVQPATLFDVLDSLTAKG
ncbi:MAG: response regulator, partial [Bryobacterales bacterium]|nr:response regulator [Bryobacterales bacterium]